MADTGWLYPSSVVSDGAGGTHWTNPGNAVSSNDSYATINLMADGTYSKRLRGYNFGASIPAGATINGIETGFERKAQYASEEKDLAIRLMDDTSVKGDNKADTGTWWPTTDGNAFYGGAADLWNASWTAAQINASTFGIAVRVKDYSGFESGYIYVDTIAVKIYYTAATGGNDHLMIMGM